MTPRTYWLTPPNLYAQLDAAFRFDFDPCPHPMPTWNGLERDWGQSNFVNPPHDRLTPWIRKALKEHDAGRASVILLPVDSVLYDLLRAGPQLSPLVPFEWVAPDGSGKRKPAGPILAVRLPGRSP